MPVPPIQSFSIEEIARNFDAGSFARGRAYARAGYVVDIEAEDDEPALYGEVRGSGLFPYDVSVFWTTINGRLALDSQCSCPVGAQCKHAVALIFTVLALAGAASGLAAPTIRQGSAWRQPLQPFIANNAASLPPAPTPLALQFELSRVKPHTGYRAPDVSTTLLIRPLTRGAKGQWIKTGVSWRDIENHSADPRQVREHREALRNIKAAVDSPTYGYGNYAETTVDFVNMSSSIWIFLERAAAVGVAFVDAGSGRGPIVVHPDTAELSVDLRRTPHSGDLVLRPRVKVGAAHSPAFTLTRDDFEFIGRPAHGLFTSLSPGDGAAPQITLIRLEEPLTAELTRFVTAHRELIIPAADVDEFLRDFYPRLARNSTVTSDDGSVDLPELSPPRVSLTVIYADKGSATGLWGFVYRSDGATHRVPLTGDEGDTVVRDFWAERDAMAALEVPDGGLSNLHTVIRGVRTLTPQFEVHGYDTVILAEDVLPKLRSNGQIDIEIIGKQPDFRYSDATPIVKVSVGDDSSSNDWFDLDVAISIEGEEIRFNELFVALAAGHDHLVLESGTYLRIDGPAFEQLAALIAEARSLQDAGSDRLQINRYHADLWDEFAQLGVVEHQSQRWASNVQGLLDIDSVSAPALPAGLHADLRPYQHDGYAWLSFLYDHGLGGILADDMGLGKTLQALALICRVCEDAAGDESVRPRFLVVAPTSVVENWAREATRFAPNLNVKTIRETHSRRGTHLSEAITGCDVVITSYALFRIEFEAYAEQRWAGLMLDEAQFVKNHQGKTYQCVRKLDTPFKLAISGTPLENSLMDLWALLSITAPGMYPNPRRFATNYQKPIEAGKAPELLSTLRRRIRPLMRRRTKEEVATDLPPKQEQVVDVVLNPRHARVYQTHLQRERQKILGLLGDMDKNRFAIFRSLTLLRQLSLDPALIDPKYDRVGSSKADVLLEQLGSVVAEGHRALVFSQFTGYLKRIRDRLDAEGIAYAYLDGRTRNRQQAIDAFKDGDAPVFLISLKAGGFGLNLTEADYCFVLDPWWNPATEAQAVDRMHRIGQTKTVMVYRYVATNTIEEKVMELKARKQKLFASVMDGDGALSSALDADDIRGLMG